MPVKWLDEIDQSELLGKRVLCRVDFNVPKDDDGNIIDGQRIERALPTIKLLLEAQAKVVILSHMGRPKGKAREDLTLESAAGYLRDLLSQEVTFVHDSVGHGVLRVIEHAKPGQVVFLENARFHPGEENNDAVYAKLLAKNADYYVNDAFGAVHREHASVAGITKYFENPMGGLLLKKELKAYESLNKNPKKPFVLVIGGSKVSTKIGVLLKLLPKVSTVLIGGAMAYTFLRARGENVGSSKVEPEKIALASNLLKKAEDLSVRICLPTDHLVMDTNDKDSLSIIGANRFSPGQIGVDIGPTTAKEFAALIGDARTVFWNGPLGIYEQSQCKGGTDEVMQALADCDGYTVVGGGDSIAALNSAGLVKQIDFVSTGGGAGLELLEGKKLPGLSALGYYAS